MGGTHWTSISRTSLLAGPFSLRKITTDPDTLAHVNVESPDERYPKLKICISKLIRSILDSVIAIFH